MNELFASLYEFEPIGFYNPNFSQEVFSAYLYQKYGLVLLISTLIFVFIYYKVLDKPFFAKFRYWFIVLIIIVSFNFAYLLIDCRTVMDAAGFKFEGEYVSLAISNGIYCSILFLILSLIVKNISINNSKVPF
ncbi:hypothetical protein [Sphingobacterium cellulitidis]|uniref:hypothetical protein n=1 Tax=Sphingobacterium cellulitidis TaxID=1768011 RepID=UPI000B940C3B|nr:hypothetical protein CHT99_09600 [Sphingobacterium cellulitidis]